MSRLLKGFVKLKALLTGSRNTRKKHLSIHSAEELLEFMRQVNHLGENFNNRVVELECDLDLHGVEWQPIGNDITRPFCGEFNGKGHTIRGLSLHSGGHYVGFFGVLYACDTRGLAEVRNLVLDDFEITGTETFSCTGGITGYAGEGVLIENCRVTGTVRGRSFVGGILGVANGSVGIRECSIEGFVIGENTGNTSDSIDIAGSIAGRLTTNSLLRNTVCKVIGANGDILKQQVGKFNDTLYT